MTDNPLVELPFSNTNEPERPQASTTITWESTLRAHLDLSKPRHAALDLWRLLEPLGATKHRPDHARRLAAAMFSLGYPYKRRKRLNGVQTRYFTKMEDD